MEKAHNEKLKEFFLAAFVLVCVGLILALWAKALFEKNVDTPYFYREAPQLSEAYYATRTAIAEQATFGTGTPTIEPKHREATPTLAPTATVTPAATLDPLFTPESDG
jgi:hypothetical protein